MSDQAQDTAVPMDVDCPGKDGLTSVKDTDKALLYLSLKWSESDQEKKERKKTDLEKTLQSWLNKNTNKLNCSVKKIFKDGSAEFEITPAPDVNDFSLQELNGQTLNMKDNTTVTIMSINPSHSQLGTQTPDIASMSLSPPSVPVPQTDDDVQMMDQSDPGNTNENCLISVFHYLYVSNIYKEEIKRIEEKYGGKIKAEVNVTFKADQKVDHQGALSEFTSLAQNHLSDASGIVNPLKFIDPDQLGDALKIIQKKENKLMIMMHSEEMTVCGPSHVKDRFSATLNAMQKTENGFFKEYEPAPQDTSFKIHMTIKDPLSYKGLTMEESSWKLLTTSFGEQVAKIKAKFDVDFKGSNISQDKVIVKASYQRAEGNASMESHAIRALLSLYQKTATSILNFPQPNGASGISGSHKNLSGGYESSNGPVPNTHSTLKNSEAHTGGGATAGDSKDETCPICLDSLTNKKQLKCKHEFCEECLKNTKKYNGPICPICKDVFGVMEGDQPAGTMIWRKNPTSLSGFSDCGHIVITYDIPGGTQTERHPNPGQSFRGTGRIAYLPDNKEGNEVLKLLRKAFDQKLIFTVGASRTTGIENQVTWNDIHHKTSTTGGPQNFGYPDRDYLARVKEELKAKGIV